VFMLGLVRQGGTQYLRGRVRVGGVTTTLIATGAAVETGEWYHTALTHDGSTLRLYLDGVEVASALLGGVVDADPSLMVAVGAQPAGAGGRYFDGRIDDVRVLERSLTPFEIVELSDGRR